MVLVVNKHGDAAPIMEEYFTTEDVELAAPDLRNLDLDECHHYFIKKLISMAMDRQCERERNGLKDLAADILEVVEVLVLFVVRAVVDDITPHAFLNKAKKVVLENSKRVQVIEAAEKSYLSAPHMQNLAAPHYNSIFIKKLITLAMDKKDREKEMLSVIVSTLEREKALSTSASSLPVASTRSGLRFHCLGPTWPPTRLPSMTFFGYH
ncbi:hypothetical protein MA16_Dca016016 [Dendrobium catenatum]|uniref:MI domain-containing protein n=1 Tax=Dendrobium catenatum TaxID=906689 RepID=A0A2I0VJR0_9ASPA|nr:hypothetical protein MA16_Dca016016 [Dendrobium catenatum]